MIAFYSHKPEYNYHQFSQFYRCAFYEHGTLYSYAEQYMMAYKAAMFGDFDIFDEILECESPFKIKQLGRQVKNFDNDRWNELKSSIVYNANLLKFTQDINLKKLLLGTGDQIIVEATPDDKVWGNGLSVEDTLAGKPWTGQNLLGEQLMRVRNVLL